MLAQPGRGERVGGGVLEKMIGNRIVGRAESPEPAAVRLPLSIGLLEHMSQVGARPAWNGRRRP
jgi:hypothetical protein